MDGVFALPFLTEGFVGHLSYVFLIASSLMRRMVWLRLFMIASAITGIAYDYFWLDNLVGVFWEGLLAVVNIAQIARLWVRDRAAKFTAEDQFLIDKARLGGTPSTRRILLDMGRWVDHDEGVPLTVCGERPSHLYFIARGRALLSSEGKRIGRLEPGHFVGEMSLMGAGLASADVTVLDPVRVWQIEREKLDNMKAIQPELFGLIEGAIALDLRQKVIRSNERALAIPSG